MSGGCGTSGKNRGASARAAATPASSSMTCRQPSKRNCERSRQSSQGSYDDWHATPVPTTYSWADPAACPPVTSDRYMLVYPKGCPSISGLMGGYGLLPFDRDIEVMANEALFSPGAYYAFGRWGILILIPERDRIVYVH